MEFDPKQIDLKLWFYYEHIGHFFTVEYENSKREHKVPWSSRSKTFFIVVDFFNSVFQENGTAPTMRYSIFFI